MSKDILNLTFSAFLFILFTLSMIEALTFSKLAQFFPLYISIAGSVLTLIYLITQLIDLYKQKTADGQKVEIPILKPLRYIGWILGYLLLIYIAGMLIATALFLLVFLKVESNLTLLQTIISVTIILVGILIISPALNIYWPTNLLGL